MDLDSFHFSYCSTPPIKSDGTNIAGSKPDFNIFLLRRLERALFAPKTSPQSYAAATRIKDVVQFSCPCYNVGDIFEFYRDEARDDFWHCGLNTLVHTEADPDTVAGGPKMPHCSELWDAISRYIYTGLQGGSIMKGWMERENEMIACCSDGTRPVIFKIERIDYED